MRQHSLTQQFIMAVERYMRIVQDTKKEFVYSKSEGVWYWHNRGSDADLSEPFTTFYSALYDAVEPYLEDCNG